jgi:hypothetical protein
MQGHLNLPKRIHSEPLIVHWGVWDVEPIEPKKPRIEFSVNGHLFSFIEEYMFYEPIKLKDPKIERAKAKLHALIE